MLTKHYTGDATEDAGLDTAGVMGTGFHWQWNDDLRWKYNDYYYYYYYYYYFIVFAINTTTTTLPPAPCAALPRRRSPDVATRGEVRQVPAAGGDGGHSDGHCDGGHSDGHGNGGHDRAARRYKKQLRFVSQFDSLMESQTVKESLLFSALLRAGFPTKREAELRVQEVES